jgi:uncharacterized protein YdhG (YjbR/CyaY superfamily)
MIVMTPMASAKPKPRTIDEYLKNTEDDQRHTLNKLRQTIRAAAPEVQECISYGIPAFRLNGRSLVFFAAFANHCSFFPGSSVTLKKFRNDLKGFQTSKGTIRFTPNKPLPIALVKKLVRARVAEERHRSNPVASHPRYVKIDFKQLSETTSGSRPSSRAAARCRKHVLALIKLLPEAAAVPAGGRHLSLEVRGKRFGWFLDDHHGDGRLALNLKAPGNVSRRLIAKTPVRFYAPKYIGHHGWVGVWLDFPIPDWNEIRQLLNGAYLLTAPKRLAKVPSTSEDRKT